MATPLLNQIWFDSWASPYAPELYLLGDDEILGALKGTEEIIRGVKVEVASSGNKRYWRLSFGGDWVFVKVPGRLRLEGYPSERYPVDGMMYLPIHPGEHFEGKMAKGVHGSYAVYAVALDESGARVLGPTDVNEWGKMSRLSLELSSGGELSEDSPARQLAEECAKILGENKKALAVLGEVHHAPYGRARQQEHLGGAIPELAETEIGARVLGYSRARDFDSVLDGAVAWLEAQSQSPGESPEEPEPTIENLAAAWGARLE